MRLHPTAKRAVQTFERIFATREPNCRTIVLNPTYRLTLPRRKNAKPLQFEAFPVVEMGGLEPPTPCMRSSKSIFNGPCSIRIFGPLSRFSRLFSSPRTALRIVSTVVFV